MSSTPSAQAVLDAAHHAIKHTYLSRADVETSTPEQIVWITTSRIAENLATHAAIDWDMRVTENVLIGSIQRALANSNLSDTAKRLARRVVDETATGWTA